MSKNLILIAAICFVGMIQSDVFARLTGTNPTGSSSDTWCVGKSGAEVCVDYLGDVIPTTNNDASLGTSSLQWSNVYSVAATVSGAASVTGNLIKVPVSTQTVTAAATIDVTGACGGLLRLSSLTGSVTTNTTDTFTAPTAANLGCILYLTNVGPGGTITLDDNSHFDVPANVVLGTNDGAIVVQGSTSWILLGTSDN